MVRLDPMTPAEFESFRKFSVDNYAAALCRNLKITYRAALEMARQESTETLTHGLHTSGHYFYTVRSYAEKEDVGYVWYVVNEKRKSAFLYDIYLMEQFRGRGLAKVVLAQVEAVLKRKEVQHFRLNVFADNLQARRLYEEMDFQPSSTIMQKQL